MSRGGRRRRGRHRGPKTAPPRASMAVQEQAGSQPQPRSRRRRGRRGGVAREESVLESMSSRPRQLQTLPPDGLVLDELISDLKSEYGVPATPQAYRLIIKLPAEDQPDSEASDAEVPQAQTEKPEAPEGAQGQTEGSGNPARRRRRRRGRRGQGGGHPRTSGPAGDAPGDEDSTGDSTAASHTG